jgi:transposase
MKEKLRFLGMDVHAETIAAAIAEPDGEVRSLGTIPNRMESVRKLIKKFGPVEKLRSAMKRGRLAMCCTGSWQSWAFSAR